MKIPVAIEVKLHGRSNKFSGEEQWERIEYLGRELNFAAPLKVEAEYSFDGTAFLVEGKLSTMLASECALCTKPFLEPFTTTFSERFVKEGGSASYTNQEDDFMSEEYTYVGDELELNRMLTDTILLNVSMYGVCSSECRGLCPICGCDLNNVQCNCVHVTGDEKHTPLSALAALLNDDKEV